MKKLIAVSVLSVIVGFGGVALACQGGGCFESNNGYLDLSSKAIGGGTSFDFDFTGGGFAVGGGTSFGGSQSWLGGSVKNGTIEGNVDSLGGGFSETNTWKEANLIGTSTSNFATAGGSIDAKVDPGYKGSGSFSGGLWGSASQDSFSKSGMTTGSGWDSVGVTGGFATQQSGGSFSGGVNGWSGADKKLCGTCFDSYAGAGVNVGIEMTGSSYSQSQRFFSDNGATKTEGLRNDVGASTSVTSFATKDAYKSGNAGASAWLGVNCFDASGLVKSTTVQANQNGYAAAGAVGSYSGSGSFGSEYTGKADGYTMTTLTTLPGGGSISYAAAGMKVTSFNGDACVGCK